MSTTPDTRQGTEILLVSPTPKPRRNMLDALLRPGNERAQVQTQLFERARLLLPAQLEEAVSVLFYTYRDYGDGMGSSTIHDDMLCGPVKALVKKIGDDEGKLSLNADFKNKLLGIPSSLSEMLGTLLQLTYWNTIQNSPKDMTLRISTIESILIRFFTPSIDEEYPNDVEAREAAKTFVRAELAKNAAPGSWIENQIKIQINERASQMRRYLDSNVQADKSLIQRLIWGHMTNYDVPREVKVNDGTLDNQVKSRGPQTEVTTLDDDGMVRAGDGGWHERLERVERIRNNGDEPIVTPGGEIIRKHIDRRSNFPPEN